MPHKFQLHAFYSNPKNLIELLTEGIDGVIVDWEEKGKNNRQNLYNTQVNKHSKADLSFVRKQNPSNLICRINGPEYWSIDEINEAIDLGASELLVPMIKNLSQAEFILNQVDGRINVGLMLETNESLLIADQLNELPIDRFFVGLNDLSIQRKSRNIFLPFIDGTIDELRPKITKEFGIAGLTHPSAGVPIPCSLLIKQIKKYKSSFGFLRRSFYKDLDTYSINDILTALRNEFDHELDITHHDLAPEETQLLSAELI